MTAFDESAFRAAAAAVREYLPSDIEDDLLAEHGDWAAVLDEMTKQAAATCARLAGHGRDVPVAGYLRLAIATIAPRNKGIHANPTHIAKAFTELVDGDVPIELGVQSRWLTDDSLLGLLVATWRTERELLAGPTPAPPTLLTMVAAALTVALGTGAPGMTTRVQSTLDRADELVVGHLERVPPHYGADSRFVVFGNSDIVALVAACRTAVLETAGRLTGPVPDSVDDGVTEITKRLDKALRYPPGREHQRDGKEVNSLVALRSFARFIGDAAGDGNAVAVVFGCLHHDLMALPVAPRGEHEVGCDNRPELQDRTTSGDALLLVAEFVACHLLHALYEDVAPIDRDLVTTWLAGRREPDTQDRLPLLVSRVRLAAATLTRRTEPPELGPELRARLPAMTRMVQDSLRLGHTGPDIVTALLPALWTRRSAAVKYVQSSLRAEMTSRQAIAQKSRLVAATVVRAPSQWVVAGATPDAPKCPCGACEDLVAVKRTTPADDQVCPHRPWYESGPVESYTTLAEYADYVTADAVRMNVRRYEGPWRHWLRDAFSIRATSPDGE
jgi:hypothetical protein